MLQPRVRIVLAVVTAVAAAAVGIALIAAPDPASDVPAAPANAFEGAMRPENRRAPDFRLRDQDGRPVSLASLRGRTVVLTFLFSTCKDVCPLQADQIRGALDELPEDPAVVAVSVDPDADTPERARRFLVERGLSGRMQFALGDRRALTPIWRAYGIQPQDAGFDHTAHLVVIDRTGRERVGFPAAELTTERLAHDVALLQRTRR